MLHGRLIKLRHKTGAFASGVIALSLSAVAVKIIGLFYKIPMLGLLGSEGMGYFNSAYEIYAMLCIISTTGLPVAMSATIAAQRGRGYDGERVFSLSKRLVLLMGLVGSVSLALLGVPISTFFKSEKAIWSILAISPAVLLVCVASAYRGYFQGIGDMVPTAVSQVIEAVGKLVLGLALSYAAITRGWTPDKAAACAVLGLCLGELAALIYLAVKRKRVVDLKDACADVPCDSGKILSELLKTAVPVTLAAALTSAARLVDMGAILRRLQDTGFSSEQAFSAYGSYTTMALPLFSLAPALIGSVALPLVPALSEYEAKGDAEGQMAVALRALSMAMFAACPAAMGLALFSGNILTLVFPSETAAVQLCAPLLSALALSVPLSCLITVGNAILGAYRMAHVSLISMGVGVIVKTALAYALIGRGELGLIGAPISTLACDLCVCAAEMYCISRRLPQALPFNKIFVKPYLISLCCVTAARFALEYLEDQISSSTMATLAAIALAAVSYVGLGASVAAAEKLKHPRKNALGRKYRAICDARPKK